MTFRPNPLLYGANEDFLSSFKLALTMRDPVDRDLLAKAVEGAMARYPYFCVLAERRGNELVLGHNPRPVPVFGDGRDVVLGSEESKFHLVAFSCAGRQIYLNASHYIADGMGIDPLLKTVLYLYVKAAYGTDEGICTERICMPGEPIDPKEYAYPFFDEPIETESLQRKAPAEAYTLDPDAFDQNGLYAYHLHIPQKAMMAKAGPSDGSPVSFLSVMLYRAIMQLDASADRPIVAHVQHQYRAAIHAPLCRHSLVSYIPVSLPPKAKKWDVEFQNTVIRGQVILGSEHDAELEAIGRLVSAFPGEPDASFAERADAMRRFSEDSILAKTFGISYVGRADWCGLDRYVEDIHAYIGEKASRSMLLIEVMTIGEDFTINFMQSGSGRRYLDAFVEQIRSLEIPVRLIGEERYSLCGTRIPSVSDN